MKKNKTELKKTILEENKNGSLLKEKSFIKTYPENYNELVIFVETNNLIDLPFREKLYLYVYELNSIPKCGHCLNDLTFKKSFREGYGSFCSISCANKSESHKKNVKETNNIKFGGNSPITSKEVKDKIKNTNLKKYGVENVFQLKEYIQEKTKIKYGNSIMTKTNHYKTIMKEKYEEKYANAKIVKEGKDIIYNCNICNKESIHEYNSFNYRVRNNIDVCKHCVPPYQSMIEIELENFLNKNNFEFTKHNRKIISPKEIDFYIIDKKIGIELNGLYYHSEMYLENDYHQKKWMMCNDLGIQLIQIWEDEWKFKNGLITEFLKRKIENDYQTIYARKCIVKEINSIVYKEFVEKYHIQGYASAKYKYGLFFNNELIQVMSFSNNRKFMGLKNNIDEYEIIRLCTITKYKIIGGSNKILSYFEKTIKPKKIITYSDNRYFNGNTYENLGFQYIGITKPNYYYIKPNEIKRYHRFNFRKDKLIQMGFDSFLSESKIMSNIGYLKLFDAGNKKYEKILL